MRRAVGWSVCVWLLAVAPLLAQPRPGEMTPRPSIAEGPAFVSVETGALATQPRRRPVRDVPDSVQSAEPPVRIRLSGQVGVTSFTASDSFEAVLDTSSGVTYGGGAGVLIGRHLFIDVQASRFSADGERVFVTDDRQVFPLGIPATVTVTPIDVTAGWRFTPGRPIAGAAPKRGLRPVPFVGGGVGVLQYRETADFSDAGDDVEDSHGSYHLLGGVELPITRRLGASFDGLYRWVPDALGESGVSAVYGDTDLGGFTFRVRALFTF